MNNQNVNTQQDPVQKSILMSQLAQELTDLDKKIKTIKGFTKERMTLEDQRMRLWWQLRAQLLNKPQIKEDHGMGYSHNVSLPQDQNTMDKPTICPVVEQYQFTDHDWLSNMAGFGMPIDVYYKTVLLGVIETTEKYYHISMVNTPLRPVKVNQSEPWNKFKTKNDAAHMLHVIWAKARKKGTGVETI